MSLSARDQACALSVDVWLNGYARDIGAAIFGPEPPTHDAALARAMREREPARWLRVRLARLHIDLFAPIIRLSETGRHGYGRPLLARDASGDELSELPTDQLLELIVSEHAGESWMSADGTARVCARMRESCDNLAAILERRRGASCVQDGATTFLASEQNVVAGHPFHPLAKSRWGFTRADLTRFSPELGATFRLHFFLGHPSIVTQRHAGSVSPFERLKALLAPTAPALSRALARHPDYVLLPVHPWEADFLSRDPRVRAAVAKGLLIPVGEAGPAFAATSSVRTVFSAALPYMLKLSLHVAITNCERINHGHEMRKGVGVARLLASPWGARLAELVPALRIVPDTAFVSVSLENATVDGFSTLVRDNPYAAHAPVVVTAALAEPPAIAAAPLPGMLARIARRQRCSLQAAGLHWGRAYLRLLFECVIGAYARAGLMLEAHLQNVLVELDGDDLPVRVHFRDNQGFFFRAEHAGEILAQAPELDDAGPCILPDAMLYGPFAYYLFVNNVLGMVQAIAAASGISERELLEVVRAELGRAARDDATGFAARVLEARGWPFKANLRMALEDRDELTRPVETPATYLELSNPLWPLAHGARALLSPDPDLRYRRRFPGIAGELEIRPLVLQRDLTTLHDWVNQEYAKRFWDMQGPVRELEAYYRELLASRYAHAFAGFHDAELAFVFEAYWAPRDVIGRHYDALPDDHGFHVIVAPVGRPPAHSGTMHRPIAGFTARVTQLISEFMLREPEVGRLVAEPHHENARMIGLFERVGFVHRAFVELEDKRANLLICSREAFARACPDSRRHVATRVSSLTDSPSVRGARGTERTSNEDQEIAP